MVFADFRNSRSRTRGHKRSLRDLGGFGDDMVDFEEVNGVFVKAISKLSLRFLHPSGLRRLSADSEAISSEAADYFFERLMMAWSMAG